MNKALHSTIKKICFDYQVSLTDIKSSRRNPRIIEPRWLCWELYKNHSYHSFPKIGSIFNRDHSTIIQGLKKIKIRYGDKVKKYEDFYHAEKEKYSEKANN
jgi:chromosomal replication initiation ATPase DnaA|tara:strand:- start:14 stop:316 length:303 start_codon:yes stop_codon:yes gene_type:complete